jgi:hypothetical protein
MLGDTGGQPEDAGNLRKEHEELNKAQLDLIKNIYFY